jgi:hypothetical protein
MGEVQQDSPGIQQRERRERTMNILEAAMLICFGVSWPVSISKSLRTRVVDGKSPLFMSLLILGYGCGVANKLLGSRDWVTLLYALNLVMVAFDLALYYRFRTRPASSP